MIICNDCKKEMRCEHTGTRVRFGCTGDHVYAGDTFECPQCHKKTTVCNQNPYQDNIVVLSAHDVIMEQITDTSKIKKRTINLRRTEESNGRTNTERRGSIPATPNDAGGDGTESLKYINEILQEITNKGWYLGDSPDDLSYTGRRVPSV